MTRSRGPSRFIAMAICTAVLCILLAHSASAQYAEYRREVVREPAMRILFTKKAFIIEAGSGDNFKRESYQRNQVTTTASTVMVGNRLLADSAGLHANNTLLPLKDISTLSVEKWGDTTILILYRFSTNADSLTRVRKGNRSSFSELLTVQNGDYCRGFVLSVVGNIVVDGEVQKDVISLFGNVIVGGGAVVRGDIATIDGSIKIERQASVYGRVHYEKEKRKFLSQRHRDKGYFTWGPSFRYNRVDGATPSLYGRFDDPDSLLPSFWLKYGYAFETERIRFGVGFDQPLYRPTPVFVGAEMYQSLSSDDDWLLDDKENTAFALLVTEDFKDYYESRGGRAWVRLEDSGGWNLSASYAMEETRWFDANPNVFSLFGGDKRFIPNFGHAPGNMRYAGITEIDTSEIAELRIRAEFDTQSDDEQSYHSAWVASAGMDWSNPDIGSDFDYRRYWGSISREQRINLPSMIVARVVAGGSDGYLPMHRRFAIGGLGTLRGYRHKEYWGTQYWFANFEYRVSIPKSAVSLGLIYDVGQIANDVPISSNVEVKHSIGAVGYFIDDDFSISCSRRLDASDSPTLQLFVRLSRHW